MAEASRPLPPSPPPVATNGGRIRRKLEYNLPSKVVVRRIREAERLAGEERAPAPALHRLTVGALRAVADGRRPRELVLDAYLLRAMAIAAAIASSVRNRPVAADLALWGRRMLLVDLLGAGFSDRPAAFGYAVEDHARVLA